MVIPRREVVYEWVDKWWPQHLCLELPSTIDEYVAKVDKDVRTQCRKAQREGYVARWTTAPDQTDIALVWDSWEGMVKNNRPINRTIAHCDDKVGAWTTRTCWPFSYYPHTQGYLDMVEVVDSDGLLMAYLEIATHGEHSVVWHTMCHQLALKHGVSKLLFVEAARGLIERGVRYFHYLKPKYIKENPGHAAFALDLRFKAPV